MHVSSYCQAWTLKQPCRAVAVREANCAWLIVDQGLMIAALQVDLRLVFDTVVDHRIKPITLTGRRNRAGPTVIEQFFDFVLGGELDIQAELCPEIVYAYVV